MATPVFDQIADVYDETRRGLDEATLKGIEEMLNEYACRSILEIGVGTGRIALPLIKSGFEVTGMDISRRMMEKATAKGMRGLVRAEGSKAPFREKSFDAALMAHVFHLLDDPQSVMREAARVSRVGVFALVRKRSENHSWSQFYSGDNSTGEMSDYDEDTKKFFQERRERFRKIFKKYGQDPSKIFPNWRKEKEVLDTYPPDELRVVSDAVVTENIEDRIARFEKGSYSSFLRMPVEMRKEIVEEMRAYSASPRSSQAARTRSRHEVYQLALWNPDKLLVP